ncbi:MAG: hypothetical protein ACOYNM_16365 [Gemmataceae bacterium]
MTAKCNGARTPTPAGEQGSTAADCGSDRDGNGRDYLVHSRR